MPVFPLVGSTNSTPGCSNPRCSASQIMDAPIRHFTEYAGLRPSILASTVAPEPSTIRFSLMSGVFPILNVLSAKNGILSLPRGPQVFSDLFAYYSIEYRAICGRAQYHFGHSDADNWPSPPAKGGWAALVCGQTQKVMDKKAFN